MTDKRIVLGVTGGVAAYKACELVRLCVKAGITVDVVMTQAGEHFVAATTDRKSTRLNSSHGMSSRMPSSA